MRNNYKLTSDILIQTIENEAVIVSPSQGMITTVNETGSLLLNLIKEKGNISFKELVDALRGEYNISQEQSLKDVKSFIFQMEENKIIQEYVL